MDKAGGVIKLIVNHCDEKEQTEYFYQVNNKTDRQNYSNDLQKILEIEHVDLKNQDHQIIKLRKKNKELKNKLLEMKNISQDYSKSTKQRVQNITHLLNS